jgi:hypothetical protein
MRVGAWRPKRFFTEFYFAVGDPFAFRSRFCGNAQVSWSLAEKDRKIATSCGSTMFSFSLLKM